MRTSALGSASARPELETAIAEVHDEAVPRLCRILEPCRDRGWLRLGIDLASAVELMDSLRFGRIHIERGQMNVDPAEWDQLAIEALAHASFGR